MKKKIIRNTIVAVLSAVVLWQLPTTALEKHVKLSGPEKGSCSFAVVSDTHVYAEEEHSNNIALAEVGKTLAEKYPGLDFVFNSGDMVDSFEIPMNHKPSKYYGKDREPVPSISMYNTIIRDSFPFPTFASIGNHDYYWDKIWKIGIKRKVMDRILIESLSEISAMPYMYYEVEFCGFSLFVLNSGSKSKDHVSTWIGSFDDKQLDWLESKLTQDKKAIIAFHHFPDTPELAKCRDFPGHETPFTDRIFTVLEEHKSRIEMILVGHGHRFVSDTLSEIPIYMTGDPHHAPGYHIVSCETEAGECYIANTEDIEYNKFENSDIQPEE